jgi:ABC-type lipoprotein release transport system permease subunit
MNGEDYRRLWGTPWASQLAVALKPGVPLNEGELSVRRALAGSSGLTVLTDAQRESEWTTVLGGTPARLEQTSTVVLLVAIAAVVAMMVAAVWQRRGRLDALMSIGMSSAQLARLVFYESGSVLLGGCLVGFAAGILGQALGDNWLNHAVGVPVRFTPAWQLGLRTIFITVVIAMAAVVVAVLRTASFQPKAAFSTE